MKKIGYGILFLVWLSFLFILIAYFLVKKGYIENPYGWILELDLDFTAYLVMMILSWLGMNFILIGPIGKREKQFIGAAFLNPVIFFILLLITSFVGCWKWYFC